MSDVESVRPSGTEEKRKTVCNPANFMWVPALATRARGGLVVDQRLAEGLALVRELERVLEAHAREAVRHHADEEALVVEVVHDVLEALALLAEEVLRGHLRVRSLFSKHGNHVALFVVLCCT